MTTTIHSLSVELVENIYRHLDPASHLDFALADKHIFRYSHAILKRHGKYHHSYNTLTDDDPNALISVLHNVATDHIAAWHIRTFKGLNASKRHIKMRASEVELNALARTVHAAMVSNGIPAFSLLRLRNGDIEALQTAILALCTGPHAIQSTDFFLGRENIMDEKSSDDIWCESDIP
jgi:hypothetical protein